MHIKKTIFEEGGDPETRTNFKYSEAITVPKEVPN